ncbi:MAG: putative lipid II flippase FtsW [Proteobacteria bacterium]|nr:putative lipid II flippase FtsW [Pseudomonadota bacterium]
MASSFFSRTDTSLIGRWWWAVDRWMLLGLCLLMGIGCILSFSGTPFIAKKLGLSSFYMVEKQLLLFIPSFFLMVGVSMLPFSFVKKLSFWIFGISLFFLILTPFWGIEIKGARRWINILGFSLQPSEFIKPTFSIVSAWILNYADSDTKKLSFLEFSPRLFSFALYVVIVFFLLLEPDLGMTFVVSCAWGVQIFLAGLSFLWVFLIALLATCGLFLAYFLFPHVSHRIDRFLDPEAGDRYQINHSLEAFMNGGFFGLGPGEGVIKKHLPDAHSDFIFAVAGEEFGLLFCLLIVGIYAFIIFRSFSDTLKSSNYFIFLSICGLSTQFGIQALVNMASSLHLIPTKGMTLPFLSYGGSSLLALSLGMGILLNFTRKRLGYSE